MAFLRSESLKELLPSCIHPFEEDRIKHGAYELSLGPEIYMTSDGEKRRIEKSQQIGIEPGQFALLLTEEYVQIPKDMIAFISIKAGTKFRGLVNVSGFHVDPGFQGRLKFAVYNAGTSHIVISRGQPLFPIWLARFDGATEHTYDGTHRNQRAISNEDVMRLRGKIASPSALSDRIDILERKLDLQTGIATAIIVGLVVLVITILADTM